MSTLANVEALAQCAGKMNFYLSAGDDMVRHPDDKPSIGLILCKAKNGLVAEYALRDVGKPLGISEFMHLEQLPERLARTLPAIEAIEAELGNTEEPAGVSRRANRIPRAEYIQSARTRLELVCSPPDKTTCQSRPK